MTISAAQLKKIYSLHDQQVSGRKIAARVGVSHTTVQVNLAARLQGKPDRKMHVANSVINSFTAHLAREQVKSKMLYQVTLKGSYQSWQKQNKPSLTTIRRRIKGKFKCVTPKAKLALMEGDQADRVRFAQKHLARTNLFWSNTIHLDPTTVSIPTQ